MYSPNRSSVRPLPLRPLAACLAAALGMADAALANHVVHPGGAIVVTSCADSGAGSLRAAVQDDSTGDPIDLSQLPCSLVTLTSGAIHAAQALTLLGPGSGLLTIDGSNNDRIFTEDAAGATLAIYGMTLQNGYGAFVSGGCIYSAGPVVLDDAVVTGCSVFGQGVAGVTYYLGGGLYVKGDVTATDSRVVGNNVYASPGVARGGGVYATGDGLLVHSTISGNTARVPPNELASGGGGGFFVGNLRMSYSTVSGNLQEGPGFTGGLVVKGFATIDHSTISDNTAAGYAGIAVVGRGWSTISDSTISGNTAYGISGALVYGPLTLANSTIAFNVETGEGLCAGLCVYSYADIESSIIALNSSDGVSRLNVSPSGRFTAVVGANDLIGESDLITLPPGTIQSDPMLGPLADNGGLTFTHALLPGSPAIDTGNNSAQLNWDQRGQGYPRVIGIAPDIGAFESAATDQPPVAADDSYATAENTTLTVNAPGVLGNDSDPDGDSLTVVLVGNPSNGVLTLNPDGSFVYVPTVGFSGTDSFTYEANDGQLSSNIATVMITVADQPPVAADDSYATAENTTLTVNAPGVLGNDSDPEGDSLTVVLVGNPSNGVLTLNPDGSFVYVPTAGFSGTDTFTYEADDGQLNSNIATVMITVSQGSDNDMIFADGFD